MWKSAWHWILGGVAICVGVGWMADSAAYGVVAAMLMIVAALATLAVSSDTYIELLHRNIALEKELLELEQELSARDRQNEAQARRITELNMMRGREIDGPSTNGGTTP